MSKPQLGVPPASDKDSVRYVDLSLINTNPQSGTAYTVQPSDRGKVIETTSSNAVTITIDTHANQNIPVYGWIEITQMGTGQVTVLAATGVTVNYPRSLTTRAQYSTLRLRQSQVNVWVVSGDAT